MINRENAVDHGDVFAFIENLTGPSRGTNIWLWRKTHEAWVGPSRLLYLDVTCPDAAQGRNPVARFNWIGDGYEIEALPGQDIWLDGRKIEAARLKHGSMIEFGEHGPMSRFRLCDRSFPSRWPMDEILSDALAYARTSRKPLPTRVSGAVLEGSRRIMTQSTLLFRATVIIALAVLAAFGYLLYANDRKLEQRVRQEERRIEAITSAFAQASENALTPNDLNTLRAELKFQVTTNDERLKMLEHRSQAAARVIKDSVRSIAFLQGAFVLRHVESNKLLRHVVDPEGTPLKTPFGQPLIDPDGTGTPAEFRFTGTGFLLEGGKYLVTNRHIVRPWTIGARQQAFEDGGLEPEMLRLIAYFPGDPRAIETHLKQVSETSDLAILTIEEPLDNGRGLALAKSVPRAGNEIILIGFPTGLRAMLAKAGSDFLLSLDSTDGAEFWSVAARLAEFDYIRPLASRGIIAQVNDEAIVYDAETTTGGSGGPALDINGQVVAINAAVLPEFGGSNIGVPVARLYTLLTELTVE